MPLLVDEVTFEIVGAVVSTTIDLLLKFEAYAKLSMALPAASLIVPVVEALVVAFRSELTSPD